MYYDEENAHRGYSGITGGKGTNEDVVEYTERRWGSKLSMVFVGVVVFILMLMVMVGLWVGLVREGGSSDKVDAPRNLIFVISDGYGPASATYAREMGLFNASDEKPLLPLDKYLVGHARTFSASQVITDSAAGATAYSCNERTNNGFVGVRPDLSACGTLMEAAKRAGYTTGIVTNTRVTHATPASWSAHVSDRDEEQTIANEQVANVTYDLMFGGGEDFYGASQLGELEAKGFSVISTKAELPSATLPVVGIFAESHLSYELDRMHDPATTEPSLSEMVARALELLDQQDDPFFLFIESGRIDMAAHSNDPAAHYWEINQYMETIRILETFVEGRSDTAVVTTSDHSTGGISTGRRYDNNTYPEYIWFPDPILQVTNSMELLAEALSLGANLTETYYNVTGIDLNDYPRKKKKIEEYEGATGSMFHSLLAEPINAAALIGWTTVGHTGVDVNVYNFGYTIDALTGVMDNTFIGTTVRDLFQLGPYLDQVNKDYDGWFVPPPASTRSHGTNHQYGSHD